MREVLVPTAREISESYDRLILVKQGKIKPLSDSEWIKIARWVRFDPRLGELWIDSFSHCWKTVSPMAFHDENIKLPSPAMLGVLLDQLQDLGISKKDRKNFQHWKSMVMSDVSPAPHENFFVGLKGFASAEQMKDVERSAKSYSRWGYFGQDILVNKFSQKQRTLQKTFISAERRISILNQLIRRSPRIRVEDYLRECGNAISRRIAQLDLEAHPKLNSIGKTRGKIYFKV
jgi:hypothetical protein